jgi:hypothetical protein
MSIFLFFLSEIVLEASRKEKEIELSIEETREIMKVLEEEAVREEPAIERIELTAEERTWMTKFFNRILFEEDAIYTLCGSKPLTEIIIEEYTSEEISAYYNSLSEEEKKKLTAVIESAYDLPENWRKWEKISSRFPLKKYLFFKSELHKDPRATFLYFVNILNTALVIEEHYPLFRKVVGFDFNPLEVVHEITNKNSKFWKKATSSALLSGILFGYGKKNALTFHWKHFDHPSTCTHFLESCKHHGSNPSSSVQRKEYYAIQNFPIPSFASFDEYDEVVEKYKKERTYIQEVYKGKDFLDETLRRLTH